MRKIKASADTIETVTFIISAMLVVWVSIAFIGIPILVWFGKADCAAYIAYFSYSLFTIGVVHYSMSGKNQREQYGPGTMIPLALIALGAYSLFNAGYEFAGGLGVALIVATFGCWAISEKEEKKNSFFG